VVHVDDGSQLDEVVKGDHGTQEEQNRLQDGHERKYNPVSQPLSVIFATSFHRLEAHVGRVDKSSQVHDQLHATNNTDNPGKDQHRSNEKVDFVIPSLFFHLLELGCKRQE